MWMDINLVTVQTVTQGHYFIWHLSAATSCWLIHHINVTYTTDHPPILSPPHTHTHTQSKKWQMVVMSQNEDPVYSKIIHNIFYLINVFMSNVAWKYINI